MRKKLSLLAAGAVAVVGLGFAAASPAAAATAIGYYHSEEDCNVALAKYSGDIYHCEPTIGTAVPDKWVLLRGMSE